MAKQEITLRLYDMGFNADIQLSELYDEFEMLIKAAELPVLIEYGEKNTILLSSAENGKYMPVTTFLSSEKGITYVVSSVYGKGEQIRAQDLEKLCYKAKGHFDSLKYGMDKGKSIASVFSYGTREGGIVGGVSVAAGLAIRGTFTLAAKGMRALLRDTDAYEKEMRFYETALSVVDFVIGAADSGNIISSLTESGNNDNVFAQYLLGDAYAKGWAVEQNESEALKWFEMAAERGHLESQNIVSGEYLYSDKDYDREKKELGIKYLINLEEAGEAWAQDLLIDIYLLGNVRGIDKDYDKAMEFLRLYNAKNNPYATFALAAIYDSSKKTYLIEGPSVKNDKRALELYTRLLKNDDNDYTGFAAFALGDMYKTGRGTYPDPNMAEEYYKIAADKGVLEAKAILMKAYYYGKGVEKSEEKAKKLCEELISEGNPDFLSDAYFILHKIYKGREDHNNSIRNAKSFIDCCTEDNPRKKDVQKYLSDVENKISQMSDEERRQFLNEPEPFSFDPKTIKIIGIVCGIIVLAIVIALVIKNVNFKNDDKFSFYDNAQEEFNEINPGGTGDADSQSEASDDISVDDYYYDTFETDNPLNVEGDFTSVIRIPDVFIGSEHVELETEEYWNDIISMAYEDNEEGYVVVIDYDWWVTDDILYLVLENKVGIIGSDEYSEKNVYYVDLNSKRQLSRAEYYLKTGLDINVIIQETMKDFNESGEYGEPDYEEIQTIINTEHEVYSMVWVDCNMAYERLTDLGSYTELLNTEYEGSYDYGSYYDDEYPITAEVIDPTGANMRTGPGVEFDIIFSVNYTADVEIYGEDYGDDGYTWYYVVYKDYEGYIRSDLLELK